MTDTCYRDFVIGLESVEDSYIRELRRKSTRDERSKPRQIIDSFKDFVNKLTAELSRFIDRTKESVVMNFRKAAVKHDVRNMLKAADEKFGKGTNGITIECPDLGRYATEVQNASEKVWKVADNIFNKTYVDIDQMNRDMATFERTIDKAWEDISIATDRTTIMPIEKFRDICMNEIKGDSIVSRVISDSIHKMKKSEINLKYLEKRMDSMDKNRIVPKRLNMAQRVIARIAKFCGDIWKNFLKMACFLTS